MTSCKHKEENAYQCKGEKLGTYVILTIFLFLLAIHSRLKQNLNCHHRRVKLML